jgi:LysR family nitrogen assimilation transcriptional regulator
MNFDFRKIEYFLAIIEHGNLSRAAEALRVSQPTLSRQIHALEEQFKAPLFIRHGRGVVPTEAGKRLQEGLRGLERQLRSLRDDVADAASIPSGEVILGIPPSPRTLLGVPIVARFCRAYPQVAFRIFEKTSGEIRDMLARGEVDLAIVNPDEPMEGFTSDWLATEPMLLIGPPNAKLSINRSTKIADLAKIPLILTTRPNSLRRMVDIELSKSGVRPHISAEVDMLPLLTDLVQEGLGFTILPSCGVLRLVNEGKLSASPVEGLQITWTVARPLSVGMALSARLLLDVIFQVVEETVKSGAWPMAQLAKDCALEARKISKRNEASSNLHVLNVRKLK